MTDKELANHPKEVEQYKVISINGGFMSNEILFKMNDWGREGYILVNVVPDKQGNHVAYFKLRLTISE